MSRVRAKSATITNIKSSKKTGVLTFHRCINYGSYWQARCLVEALRARGRDAVIIDHNSRRVNMAEWKCALQPVLPTPVPRKDYVPYGVKVGKFFRAFSSLPRSRRFDLDKPGRMEYFDEVLVGSDEVWNLSHPWYAGCALFYGTGVKSKRLVSYAASFGNYSAWNGLDPWWADQLRRFNAISVRDENSRSIIRNALGFEPDLVLDPCLQFPLRASGRWRGPREAFAAVYGHNFSRWFSRQVRRWAKSRGLPLVSIGYRNDWADEQWLTAGPHDFAHAMARADAVVTNFFHGCVFALRNRKPFVCERSSYRSIKVPDLMATIGGEKHLVSEETPRATYDALLSEPLEPAMLQRIRYLRRSSAAYLDRVLV